MNVLLSTVPTTLPSIPGLPSVPSIPSIVGNSGTPYVQGNSSTAFSSGASALAPLSGGLIELLAVAMAMALAGVLVIVVVANRADPDPTGRRPLSVYFFAVAFVSVLLAVVSSTAIVVALTLLIGTHTTPIADSIAKAVALGGLVTVVSMTLVVTHLRRGVALARAGTEPTTPSRRVGQSYVGIVAFVMVLLLLVVTVFSVYVVFALIGPGVFGSFGGRSDALRYLIDAVYLGAAAGLVLWTHRDLVPPGLHPFGSRLGAWSPPGAPPGSPPAPPSPPFAPPGPPPAPPPVSPVPHVG